MSESGPSYVQGMPAIGKQIQAEFGIKVSRNMVMAWRKRKEKPFPNPDDANRYDIEACLNWVRQNLDLTSQTKSVNGAEEQKLFLDQAKAKAKITIRKDQREKLEFEIFKGEWVKKSEAEAAMCSMLQRYHAYVRGEFEQLSIGERRDKLVALGTGPEIIAAFYEFDMQLSIAIVTKIEAWCKRMGE